MPQHVGEPLLDHGVRGPLGLGRCRIHLEAERDLQSPGAHPLDESRQVGEPVLRCPRGRTGAGLGVGQPGQLPAQQVERLLALGTDRLQVAAGRLGIAVEDMQRVLFKLTGVDPATLRKEAKVDNEV